MPPPGVYFLLYAPPTHRHTFSKQVRTAFQRFTKLEGHMVCPYRISKIVSEAVGNIASPLSWISKLFTSVQEGLLCFHLWKQRYCSAYLETSCRTEAYRRPVQYGFVVPQRIWCSTKLKTAA